jgi:hypothetical protein
VDKARGFPLSRGPRRWAADTTDPEDQTALVALLLPVLGRWFDQKLYGTTFVVVSLIPVAGTGLGWVLSNRTPGGQGRV